MRKYRRRFGMLAPGYFDDRTAEVSAGILHWPNDLDSRGDGEGVP